MGLLRWVSDRLGFKSAVWFLIGGLGGRCGGRCWLWFDGLRVCVCVALLMGLCVWFCVVAVVGSSLMVCVCVCVWLY